MKLLNNINLATVADGEDLAIGLTARDRKVISAIGHGILAVGSGMEAVTAGAISYGFFREAADKANKASSRVIDAGFGVITAATAVARGTDAIREAKKAYADVKEAINME